MSKELRGKVKQKVWIRPTCADDGEPYRLGQKARRDFKKHYRKDDDEEGILSPVVSADVLAEYEEFCPNENPFMSEEDARLEEMLRLI